MRIQRDNHAHSYEPKKKYKKVQKYMVMVIHVQIMGHAYASPHKKNTCLCHVCMQWRSGRVKICIEMDHNRHQEPTLVRMFASVVFIKAESASERPQRDG